MGYLTPDVYYQPEAFGLTIVGEVEWTEPDYSFDKTVVWKDEQSQFYIGSDSGCSCPSPFEDYTSLEKLDGPLTAHEVAQKLHKFAEDYVPETDTYSWSSRSASNYSRLMGEIVEIISRVMTRV